MEEGEKGKGRRAQETMNINRINVGLDIWPRSDVSLYLIIFFYSLISSSVRRFSINSLSFYTYVYNYLLSEISS